ncbi:methionine--tRNA ligase [Pseudomonas syringae]|uniref:Methionyl-tRNA synthetase n=1 Tax=Pseudomonas syringae pv. aptata TaxID=83167 RepID=A0A0Q0DP85_PSEAP|nr:methionine--tRNA ligase [Pseudomonas syringae]KPZ03190.1 Methionyl-tRNA synthetase [Pseudomonas syringae pv. aptata]MBS7420563.1 methionine--tRNA ligase [Pseudomonas syringae]MBS7463263.1 methionine--tRNA ligase [Pseudomonas syringae]MDP5168515.1 methionine--tRNA ligase [Pseudomonas syringae pv. aptata str. DSM 50252]QVI68135.1 methionine--tRNA ligase [Pseudomonas syringae]
MSKFIVTITPPTPNGDLHIGHIAGPFLAADVFTRVQRQRGHECVLVSYSDDYQSYMLRKGLEQDVDPVELARRNSDRIEASLAAINIQPDNWMRPHDNPWFAEAVGEVFGTLRDAGAIECRDSSEPYCPDCDVWGYEAFARGNCNYCGAESDASQCENCAQAPDAELMTDLRCKLCGQPSQWKNVHRAFLKLAGFKPQLRDRLLGQSWRKPLDSWLRDSLEHLHDWGVTRPGDGGLDLQADGSCRVHTWFMGLAGYMAAFREHADRVGRPELFRQYWQSGQGTLVHFLGFDCVFSHAVVYPAQLTALRDIKVRQRFMPNQFLKLDGLNLSTSRNHAIWVGDLAREACVDSARLYLASIAPEESEGDFRLAQFHAWRTEVFSEFFPALLEAGSNRDDHWWSGLCGADAGLLEALRVQWSKASEPAQFSMKRMAQVLLDVIAITRARLAEGRPISHLAAFIAVLGKALIPDTSAQIISAYGLPEARVHATLMNGPAAEYSI